MLYTFLYSYILFIFLLYYVLEYQVNSIDCYWLFAEWSINVSVNREGLVFKEKEEKFVFQMRLGHFTSVSLIAYIHIYGIEESHYTKCMTYQMIPSYKSAKHIQRPLPLSVRKLAEKVILNYWEKRNLMVQNMVTVQLRLYRKWWRACLSVRDRRRLSK